MKHSILFIISFLLLGTAGTSQNYYSEIDYEKIKHVDKRVSKLFTISGNAEFISRKITKKYDTDLEKVRAIFVWMTHNIKYDCKALTKKKKKKRKRKNSVRCRSDAECDRKIEELRERDMRKTLFLGKGICEDYARVFQKMCEASGIEAGYIAGKTKTKLYHIGRLPKGSDHAWNWAKINGKFYLFDVTWGSGSTYKKPTKLKSKFNPKAKFKEKFQYKFKDKYFMIPPEVMILSHFPEEEEKQFLSKPLSKKEFANTPVHKTGYKKFNVIDFQPVEGSIAESQKEVVFKIKIKENISRITLNNQQGQFDFSKDGTYFYFKYKIPENPRRKIEINIYSEDGKNYPLFVYSLRRGI